MKVLVRGLGNIGTTLANLLIDHGTCLGITRVVAHTRRTQDFLATDRALLEDRGIEVFAGPDLDERALATAEYVFDCREPGAPLAERDLYAGDAGPRACAQGSETGFGTLYVVGINDDAIADADRVQIASCNTHAVATLLHALSDGDLDAIECADFVLARRAEDLGDHRRLVSGTVVARHRHAALGTHHAEDALRLFATLGRETRITCSDVTTPSQLLHTLRFAIRFRAPVDPGRIHAAIERAPHLARTEKFDGNRIFELGRRYGTQGRLYSHAIVVDNNLMIDERELRGWAFVPQEGNTLVSTLAAFMLQTGHVQWHAALDQLRAALLRPTW